MFRKKLRKRASKRIFRKGMRVKSKNYRRRPMRGGRRL